MAKFLSITTPTQPIALDARGRGTVVFSVTNDAGRAVSVRCEALPERDTEAGWLSIQGSASVHLEAGETAQMMVAVEAPLGSTPGTYACRLKAYNTERPDEDYTVGQSARFVVAGGGGTPPGPQPRNWVFVAVLAVVVLGGGSVARWLWLGGDAEVEAPDLIGRQWAEVSSAALEDFNVVTTEQVMTEAAPGAVLAQFPAAGASVPRDSDLEITLAAAPAPPDDVEVLDFVGSKVRLLQTWAASNQIEVDLSNRASGEPEGTVLDQEPREGRLAKGGTLQVVAAVPVPPVEVKEFTLSQLRLLQEWADDAGVRVEVTKQEADRPEGLVLSQTPREGFVEVGGTVAAEVAVPRPAHPIKEPIVRDHRTSPKVRDHR